MASLDFAKAACSGRASMGTVGAPPAELEVDEGLVREMLRQQHPDLAGLDLGFLASGWDNLLFRLGTELVVRLPRRALGALLMANELTWLPSLAKGLPLPTSAPVRVGAPQEGYPWEWEIVRWFPGDTAEACAPADLEAAARALGGFLAALHRPAPEDAPRSAFRGIPLAQRAPFVRQDLDDLGDVVDRAGLLALWDELAGTPEWGRPPVWLHGDVHPLNLIVDQGVLSAVVDFGDLCQGDPASDLAVAWMLFPSGPRARFRQAAGGSGPVDDDTWERARAWAIALGAALATGDERVSAIGHRTLRAVLDDPRSTL
jgi:aminoglycoside phosphotransferase (APT) family kinase protein